MVHFETKCFFLQQGTNILSAFFQIGIDHDSSVRSSPLKKHIDSLINFRSSSLLQLYQYHCYSIRQASISLLFFENSFHHCFVLEFHAKTC